MVPSASHRPAAISGVEHAHGAAGIGLEAASGRVARGGDERTRHVDDDAGTAGDEDVDRAAGAEGDDGAVGDDLAGTVEVDIGGELTLRTCGEHRDEPGAAGIGGGDRERSRRGIGRHAARSGDLHPDRRRIEAGEAERPGAAQCRRGGTGRQRRNARGLLVWMR